MKALTIASSPLRLSIVGGGSDVPSVFKNLNYGFTLSCALELRLVVSITSLVSDTRIKLKYSRSETVDNVSDIIHPIFRRALEYFDYDPLVNGGLEITSTSPIPSGTGLGSSGAFTISLVGALFDHFQIVPAKFSTICEIATIIERESGNFSVGFQDQYTSFWGNFVALEYSCINEYPSVHSIKPKLSNLLSTFVLDSTYLVRCNQRSALSGHHLSNLAKDDKIQSVATMAKIAKDIYDSQDTMCEFDVHSKIIGAGNISHHLKTVTPEISELRSRLLDHDACYVKLLGAGGGGFLFVKFRAGSSPCFSSFKDASFHKVKISNRGLVIHQ